MSFFKKLTAVKTTDISSFDKKFYQICCLCGAGVALVSFIVMLISWVGYSAAHIWSAVAFLLGMLVFFGLACVRYILPHNALVARLSDASVHLTLVAAYTPIALILVRRDLYENGSVVSGWVIFGVVAFAALFFFIASLCSTRKFRLVGSLLYMLMAFMPLFLGVPALLNAYAFAPALSVVLVALAAACFAAAPVIFWCFDSKKWQMMVYYILLASGTLISALTTLLYIFLGSGI